MTQLLEVAAPIVAVEHLRRWKLLPQFRAILAAQAPDFPEAPTEEGRAPQGLPRRLFLFASLRLNPVLKTMRELCRATTYQKRAVCAGSVSLGRFSAPQYLFHPAILEDRVRDLASHARQAFGDPRLHAALPLGDRSRHSDDTAPCHQSAWLPCPCNNVSGNLLSDPRTVIIFFIEPFSRQPFPFPS